MKNFLPITQFEIPMCRTATARGKSEQADIASTHAREDSEIARVIAKQFAPDFHQPGLEFFVVCFRLTKERKLSEKFVLFTFSHTALLTRGMGMCSPAQQGSLFVTPGVDNLTGNFSKIY